MIFSTKAALVVLFQFIASALGTCPSQKINRRMQVLRLENLEPKHVVAESTYMGELEGTHRFMVAQVWKKNNGSLKRLDEISVHPTSEDFGDCFGDLRVQENYILMVDPSLEGERSFRALAAPVSSRRKKHRQAVWEELCEKVEGGDVCVMRITLPPSTIFYRGSMKILQCKVESSSTVAEVNWYKDDTDLDTTIHRMAGIFVDKSDKENSFLMIKSASHIHNGNYKCSARNSDGQIAAARTNVVVIGPRTESRFKECKNPGYCLRGGTCRQFVDESIDPLCECRPGTSGDRCQYVADDITASSTQDENALEDMKESVSTLTTAVAMVSIALVLISLFSLFYILRLRRRLSPDKDDYDVVEQCCSERMTSTTDVQSARYVSTGNEATSVRMSVVDGNGAPDSRRSSAISSGRKNSRPKSPFVEEENEKLTPKSSFKKSDVTTPVLDNTSRQSATPESNMRRERLSAKSKS